MFFGFFFFFDTHNTAVLHRLGVPFTLGSVIHSPKDKFYSFVSPYPNLEKQDTANLGSCISGSVINAVDLVMGQDGMLWVLDVGIANTISDHPVKYGDPKIIGVEIATGKVIDDIR